MKPGEFVWYELTTGDPQGAADFYGKVLGWIVKDAGMPGMTYLVAHLGDRPFAGIMESTPEGTAAPPRKWWGYVAVGDVDAKAELAEAAGGSVVRAPGDIPGVGRFAVVADPQGACFMLFKGAGAPAPDLPYMTPGSMGWHQLNAKDWEAVFPFYQRLFGWEKAEAVDMGGWTYQLLTIAGAVTGAMMTAHQDQAIGWDFYFAVDDIDAAKGRLEDTGGQVLMGPMEVPGPMWILVAQDPQGGPFALVGNRTA